MFTLFKRFMARLFSMLTGWRFDPIPEALGRRFVLIGFPHTTNFDAPIGFAFGCAHDLKIRTLVKREVMFWPLCYLFRAMRAIVVDRNKEQGLVETIAKSFQDHKELIICLLPEGTRRPVKTIKMGFWRIAHQARVPIVMVFKDHLKKRIRFVGSLLTSNSMVDDFKKIQELYLNAGFKGILDLSIAP